MFVPNFEILGAVGPEKSLTQISISLDWNESPHGKKEKGKKEVKRNFNIVVFFYTRYFSRL